MKKSDAIEPKKTRVFKVEQHKRGKKLRRGKARVTKLESNEPKSSVPTLFLSILFCLLLAPLTLYLLKDDSLVFLFWILSTFLMGIAVYPLSLRLFKRHQGLAWLFSLPLGLTLISFSVWTLAYLKILPFSQEIVLLVTAAWALIAYLNPKTSRPALISLFKKSQWRALFLTLAAFGFALLAMTFVRGLMPAARGLEKFMDYGFMMSLWRSDYLPAADIWFSGHSINYYYYGQYAYTLIGKLAGVQPTYAYNLGMASTFAYMLTMSFGIGYMLLTILTRRKNISIGKSTLLRTTAGIGSAIFTCFAGNAHDFFISPIAPAKALLENIAQGSSRFGDLNRYFFPDATRYIGYNPDTFDKTIHEFPYYSFLVGDLHAHLANTVFVLLFVASMLLLVESTALLRFSRNLRTKHLFFPLKAYETPVEMGRHSTLMYSRWQLAKDFFKAWIGSGVLPLATLLLGLFMMGNFWDFPIYWVVLAFFLLFTVKRAVGAQSHWLSLPLGLAQLAIVFAPFLLVSDTRDQAWYFVAAMLFAMLIYLLRPSVWTSVGLSMNLSFGIAHLLIVPFNLAFSPMAKEIAIVPYHTPLFQLIVLYGPQALVFILFTITALAFAILRYKKPRASTPTNEFEDTNTVAVDAPLEVKEVNGRIWLNNKPLLPQTYKKEVDKRIEKVTNKRLRANSRSSFIRRFNPGTLAILLLFICAFGLILAPEFIYVRDIYENGFARANTMFKFTYQASILLGLALPSACVGIFAEWMIQRRLNVLAKSQTEVSLAASQMDKTAGVPINAQISNQYVLIQEKASLSAALGQRARRLPRAPVLVVFFLIFALLSAPLVYPFAATSMWLPPFTLDNYQGLDARAWMLSSNSPQIAEELSENTLEDDYAIIEWFNTSVSGQPVILEANGLSYTDCSRISAYTGLPTVLGWQTHEWLWRTSSTVNNAYASLVAPREGDVRSMYTTQSFAELQSLLQIYEVKYIVVAAIERTAYPNINEDLLKSVGSVVFSSGNAYVVEVD